MPLPAPLETATINGTWESPVGGGPLVGTATLIPLADAVSPAGDVLLTTSPGKLTLASGVASWPGVLLTDSTGLSNRVPYRLIVKGVGYYEDRTVELLKASVSGGIIRLSTIATAVPGPALASYVLQASVGQIGGPAGPLDGTGKVPAIQIPVTGGGVPASRQVATGTGLSGGGDLSVDRTLVVVYGSTAGTAAQGNDARLSDARTPLAHAHVIADTTGLQAALDAKQALDSDLTAIAALAPADGSLIQRVAGVWNSQTTAQVKASLGLVKTDVGLGNVDNTSDVAKPVSTATQTALDGKQPLDADLTTIAGLTAATDSFMQAKGSAWAARTVTQVKVDLAISNVDNTSDAGKPVSTAQQVALDAKAPLANPTFTGTTTTPRLITPPVGLADAATIATDAALGNHFRVTLAGNRTLGNPTNPTDGQKILWELIQDAAGSRTITLDTKFALGTDITSVVLTTTASKRDFLGVVYNATADKLFVIALAKGY